MAGATDTLSGSISIQAGTGTAQTIVIGSAPLPPAANTIYTGSDAGETTLSGLSDAINNAKIGVTASVVTTDGNSSIKLVSSTSGTAGDLIVTSDLYDTSSKTSSTLDYNNSSDLSTLANLGITVSSKDDGSLVFDATTLDSTLNSDYSSVVGFFQNASSWGQSFSTILNNAGTGSSAGALSLASSANSNTESTLNADVSKEESLISAQQKNLTAELNSANEIMQELPSQLEGVNELYSAITGYNQNANG
jgi:flagellar hook-associated protein 2